MRGSWLLALCVVISTTPVHNAHADNRELLSALRPLVSTDLPMRELGPLDQLPHYALDLALRDDLSGYALSEELVFTNTTGTALSEVVLRVFGNCGPEARLVTLQSGACADSACQVTNPSASVIRVQPASALEPGAALRIRLQLSGRLRAISSDQTNMLAQGLASMSTLLSGEQTSDYGLLSYGDGIASLANFYAVVAPRKGRAWITSEKNAFGDLGAQGVSFVRATLHAPRDVTVVTSGVSRDNLSASDAGTRTQTVVGSLVRDFAVLASRDFVMRARKVGDVVVRSYFLPGDADGGGRVLDTAAQALAVFEKRFGGYPYPDLDVVQAPLIGGAGGAEFSGLVTVASMLYRPLPIDPSVMSMLGATQGSALEFTTAHEVAHQYWYGLVGSDAREHPFADESLTQWSALLYFAEQFGAERATREGDAQVRMNYRMMRTLGHADGAVDRPVDAFDSVLAYGGLVYGKGAYLYPALRKLCGDASYFAALRDYAHKYRFQTAPSSGFADTLVEHCQHASQIHAQVHHWLDQSHGDADLGTAVFAADSAAAVSGDAKHAQGSLDLNGMDLGELNGMLQGMLGSGDTKGAGPALDANALKGLLDQLKAGGTELPPELQDLMGQVQKGTEQLEHLPDEGAQRP